MFNAYRRVLPPQGNPAYNQAYEELVFRQGEGLPLLMLWRNPRAVVCGKHQNLYGEVNVWQAHQEGLPLIRRESGGGAVTHGPGNLNYTMVHAQEGEWDAAEFPRPIIACLRELGVDAALFDSAGISVKDFKVSGSAQRLTGGRILHHGTLLFDADIRQVDGPLRRSPYIANCQATCSKPAPIGNIRPHLKQDMDLDAFEAYLIKRLCTDQEPYALSDNGAVKALARSKYQTWNWTYARSPRFDYRKDFVLQGKPWSLFFTCEKGLITQVRFAISNQDKPELSALFAGQRLEPASLMVHAERFFTRQMAEALLPHFFG
ncbi:MAG: lipoate--protein ligase family protein [Christensenellales bacterium]|jgi:lipoate-protein ligase A